MNDVTQKKGNGDLAAILHSYPVFTARLRDFMENPPESKETRGAKPKVFYSVEVRFLAHLVESLYKERGKPFSGSDRDRVKRCLEKGFSGESDFFDPLRSKMWIDMFSALDDQLHLFTPTETDGFADFFTNYIALYGKINNTKTVPFYGRWIRETAAMYTVYLHETYDWLFKHSTTDSPRTVNRDIEISINRLNNAYKGLKLRSVALDVRDPQGNRAVSSTNEKTSGAEWHTIKEGDTLGHIAIRYNTTVKRLCALNGISEKSILRLGKKLRVR